MFLYKLYKSYCTILFFVQNEKCGLSLRTAVLIIVMNRHEAAAPVSGGLTV